MPVDESGAIEGYECSYCQRMFTERDKLIRHIRIHTGEKPYNCPHCSQAFARTDKMYEHVRSYHRMRIEFKCRWCDKNFPKYNWCRGHESVTHPEELRSFLSEKSQISYSERFVVKRMDDKPEETSIPSDSRREKRKTKPIVPFSYVIENSEKKRDSKPHGKSKAKKPRIDAWPGPSAVGSIPLQPANLEEILQLAKSKAIERDDGQSESDVEASGKSDGEASTLEISDGKHEANEGALKLKCTDCSETFDTKQSLVRHWICHLRPCKCSLCDSSFLQPNKIIRHLRNVHKLPSPNSEDYSTRLSCRYCNGVFDRANLFVSHVLEYHDSNIGPATVVGFISSQQANLERTSVGEGKLKCNRCRRTFASKSGLTQHAKSHRENLRCSVCGASFTKHITLVRHQSLHMKTNQCDEPGIKGEPTVNSSIAAVLEPFKCFRCEMTFTKSDGLKEHLRCHTDDKPFKCCHCDKSFSLSDYLRLHMLTHEESKDFIT